MNLTESLFHYATSEVFHKEVDLNSYKEPLYHYTDTDGLLGILSSQKIWASESSYLNDLKEIDYGVTVISEILLAALAESNCSDEKFIFNEVLREISERPKEVYIACFSEEGDLLSQWKGYSDFGKGYAVEFDTTELSKFKRKSPFVYISIKKVIYKLNEQEDIVKNHIKWVLQECNKLIKNHPDHKNDIIYGGVSALVIIFQHLVLFFKDIAFSEEKEWRAFYSNSDPFNGERIKVRFRSVNCEIIPYLPLDIGPSAQKDEWCLPIASIILGSKVNCTIAERSIRLIYANLEVDPPEFKYSMIPLR